ncbi:MAG: hypothetical protein K6G58_07100 [Lachnospiraceae bacterium]|nr:hypothetical protein [Lachnospiraceae bacterium]
METEHIYVDGEEKSADEVLTASEKYAADQGFSEQESLRLRLLSEELLGLLNGITSDDYTALFWIEGDKKVSRLHLNGKINMTSQRREELISTAKSGRNEAAVGIVGKIRDMIAVSVLRMNEELTPDVDGLMPDYFGAGSEMMMSGVGPSMAWSLNAYRNALEDGMIDLDQTGEFEKREPWDELERSVIANLADDVKVKIVGDDVEILVERSVGS